MAEPKRISDLLMEFLKDIALAYGVAALAVPYLKGCNRVGAFTQGSVYVGVATFSTIVSLIAVYRTGTEIRRRYEHRRVTHAVIVALTFMAMAINGIIVYYATDTGFQARPGIPAIDNLLDSVIERFAFAKECTKA